MLRLPLAGRLSAALLIAAAAAVSAAPEPSEVVFETTIPRYLASGRAVAVTSDGGAVVGGRFIGANDDNEILLARVDAAGDTVWVRTVEGYDHDHLGGLVLDAAGDVYASGWTDSDDFPVVGFDTPLTGFRDAFLMKLDGDDGSLVFSRLLGGEYTDMGYDLTLAPNGDVVMVGSTISRDFPTVDPVQAELNSYPYESSDAFVTRFTPDGATIVFSTFLGGSTDDTAYDVAVDAQGRIVFSGETLSSDFPTAAAFQAAGAGGRDMFVARLNAAADALEFSTYLGGEDTETPGGLAVDLAGAVYVAGASSSVDMPTTAGAFEPVFVGAIDGCAIPFGGVFNCEDGFVAKFAPDGGSLVYGTYLGGTEVDEVRDLAVDDAGRARVAGYTYSSDFPTNDGSSGVFALELAADGAELTASFLTFSGSSNAGHAIAIGPDGDTYMTGAIDVPADLYLVRLTGPAAVSGTGNAGDASRLHLAPGAPNPFQPRTTLRYVLPAAGHVRLEVFDLRGRRVRTLVDRHQDAGAHRATWTGRDDRARSVAQGVYFLRLRQGERVTTRRITRLR